jgi:hypothetical protein
MSASGHSLKQLFVNYDNTSQKFSLSPEQARVFAEKDSPVYLAGAFDIVAAMIEGEQKVEHSFPTGAGVRWGDSAGCLSQWPVGWRPPSPTSTT